MYLLRIILVFLIVILIVRAFIIAGSSRQDSGDKKSDPDIIKGNPAKGVPKNIGEYVDYEESDRPA